MHKLRKLFPLVGALLALAFVSCGSDSDDGSEAAEQQKTAGSISYATTTVSKTTDDEPFTNELTKTGDGTVTYASSDEAVAQVDEKKGEVTIKGAGKATITAKVEDSDTYTYATKTASYTLTVTQASPLNLNLKTGGAIHSILVQLCPGYGTDSSACTKFARSETNNASATLYLDTEEKYIPVWSVDTEVYYYVPDGCTPVMNEDSSKMFYGCSELTRVDVSSFDTSKVTNMEGMFANCSGLTSLDLGSFNTSKVTNMRDMFYGCSALNSLDLGSFNTGSVTDMNGMFMVCSALTNLDLGSFNTSKVTDMSGMFYGCSALTSLDLGSFDTGSVTNMMGMFDGCSKLTNLNLSSFNTSKVTNMSSMFCDCSALTSLDLGNFDTGSVTYMVVMFDGCSALTNLNLSSFNTGNVTDMSYMFRGCSKLTSLDVGSFNTSKVTNMSGMFDGCSALMTIYATNNFVTTNVTSDFSCFADCTNLRGGAGTTYAEYMIKSAEYARIDGGTDAPGYFTLKPIGSKSKPDAVGDIVFSDGSAEPYTADLTLTAEQKAAAIAVIFDADKKLGVGLKQGTDLAWATGTTGCNTEFATSTTDGSGNWKVIVDAADKLTGVAADAAKMEVAAAETSYPAFNFANTYGVSVAGVEGGWYLPAKDELNNLCESYRADGSAVKEALAKCTGTIDLSTGYFWSSSQYASDSYVAWYVKFGSGNLFNDYKENTYSVCAVRAFN